MIDQSPERWANFQRRVEELQASAPPGVQYKALFLGRHGQGWHNFCSDKYGVEVSLFLVTLLAPANLLCPRMFQRGHRCDGRAIRARSEGADCRIVIICSNLN